MRATLAAVVSLCLLVLCAAPLAFSQEEQEDPATNPVLRNRIEQAILDLGSEIWEVREKATRELKKLGKPALPFLEKAAEDKQETERAWRARKLLEELRHQERGSERREGQRRFPGSFPLSWGGAEGVTIQQDGSGHIKVTVRSTNEEGETIEQVYEADSMEEFQEQFPEVAEKYGLGEESPFHFSFNFGLEEELLPDWKERLPGLEEEFSELQEQLGELLGERFGENEDLRRLLEGLRRRFEDFDPFERGWRWWRFGQEPFNEGDEENDPFGQDRERWRFGDDPFDNEEDLFVEEEEPLPEQGTSEEPAYTFGLGLCRVPDALRDQLGLPAGRGLLVEAVTPEELGAQMGLCRWDVVLQVNDKPVTEARELRRLLREEAATGRVQLLLRRKGQAAVLDIPAPLLEKLR